MTVAQARTDLYKELFRLVMKANPDSLDITRIGILRTELTAIDSMPSNTILF